MGIFTLQFAMTKPHLQGVADSIRLHGCAECVGWLGLFFSLMCECQQRNEVEWRATTESFVDKMISCSTKFEKLKTQMAEQLTE